MRRNSDLSKSSFFVANARRVLLPLVLLMTAFPSYSAQLPIQYELIARSGVTPVPDAVGAFLGFGGAPAMDNDGNIVFGGGNSNQAGVYTFIGGTLQKVADHNTLIPGGGGETFNLFSAGDMYDIDGGRVAFKANNSSLIVGLYSNVGQATSSDLVELALVDGVDWSESGDPWIDNDFVAMGGRRLTPNEHNAILLWDGLDLSESFFDPGTGYSITNDVQASISGGATIFTRNSSSSAEMGILSGGNFEALATISATPTNSTPMPGLDGERFNRFYKFAVIDRDGLDAVFLGSSQQKIGLFKRVNGGALENVVDNTTIIPSSGGDVFKIFMDSRYSLANGQVVFMGDGQFYLKGMYTDIGGELSVIIDDQTNNTIEIDGQTEQITSFELGPKSFAYTPQGYMVVFEASLQSGGTTIIRATIKTTTTTQPDILFSGGFES